MRVLAVLGALSFVFPLVAVVLGLIATGALEALGMAGNDAPAAVVLLVLAFVLGGAGIATWAVLRAAFRRWQRV